MTICCNLFDLALTRAANKQARLTGLEQRRSIVFSTGKMREHVIYQFPKAPRGDRTEFANVSYAEVQFCPFCGGKVKSC